MTDETTPPITAQDAVLGAALDLPSLSLAITTVEDTSYGDHGERIVKAHAYVPGETVETLIQRVFATVPPPMYRQHNYADTVEIRVVVGTAEPEPISTITAEPF